MPSRIALVCDSTADLSTTFRTDHNITVVPLKVIVGTDEYIDGVTLHPRQLYEMMRTSSIAPRTSQPTPTEFEQAFRSVADSGADTIICTTIASELSGTYNAALQARAALPNLDIRIVDSRTAALGHNAIVRAAVAAIEHGDTAETVIEFIEKITTTQRILFTVATLEYLRRGGRIGGARALIGSVLDIKPVLLLEQGRISPLDKVRTYKRALQRMVEELRTASTTWHALLPVTITHADRPDDAAFLAAEAKAYSDSEPVLIDVGPVIACHGGPGAIGISFYRPE